ncbi:response regulator [Terrihabitans sp. B22-R8]|uniref:response regulator n=1 Tax=Terrihabitans sp. B22-R8 TaxID=3425128 RepID=UPI00403D0E49
MDLSGRRILVVEDEMLVSMLVTDILEDFGCTVIGPATRLAAAVEAAEQGNFDAALLDVNLAGARVFPVADLLAKRGIPFIFVSGYGDMDIDAPHEGRPVVQKPFSPDALGEALARALA